MNKESFDKLSVKEKGTYILVPEDLFDKIVLFSQLSSQVGLSFTEMKIGKIIKAFRFQKEMSLVALAKEVQISRQALARIENGETEPQLRSIQLLTNFFGKDFEYFVEIVSKNNQKLNGAIEKK